MDFDHAPLCEEPSALSGNEVSFAFLMSDSAEEIADAQIPDDSLSSLKCSPHCMLLRLPFS